MLLENSYSRKNTVVHNLNPIIKFVILLSIVFLLFLRISFILQAFLIGFVALIVKYSDCQHLSKKIWRFYFGLLCFLFFVNFVFMKNPGFWMSDYERSTNYRDILGLFNEWGIRNSNSDNGVKHGWYFGGKTLSMNGSSSTFVADKYECIEQMLGWKTGSSCSQSSHNHGSNVAETRGGNAWKIITLTSGNGIKKYIAFLPYWYMISAFQLVYAVGLANKITLIVTLSAIFSMTCSLASFTYALEDIFRPLKAIKLPSKTMALAIAIAMRFIPSLITETFRIIKAQASRGIDYKNGRFKDKASALLSLFVPLFVISFLKSSELSEAMKARGYDSNHSRSSYRTHISNSQELLILFGSMSFISSLYYLFSRGYYLGLFSTFEYLVLLAK